MIIFLIIIWNIIVFAIYGIDKKNARNNKRRVSEKTLIGMAFLDGGIGAFLGMRIFRHKTRVLKFRILVPLSVFINLVVFVVWCKWLPLHFL